MDENEDDRGEEVWREWENEEDTKTPRCKMYVSCNFFTLLFHSRSLVHPSRCDVMYERYKVLCGIKKVRQKRKTAGRVTNEKKRPFSPTTTAECTRYWLNHEIKFPKLPAKENSNNVKNQCKIIFSLMLLELIIFSSSFTVIRYSGIRGR